MKRSKTSKSWMNEHVSDAYVKRAQMVGYRSRAAFKLIEANEKYQFLGKKMNVIDLGSVPGSWSQVLASLMDGNGYIFALDLLDMDPIKGVDFIQGDFREQGVLKILEKKLDKTHLDLVISDMAPNMTGVKVIDQAKLMNLAELALDLARSVLKPGAYLLVKVFQGEGIDQFQSDLRRSFKSVKVRKPNASRARSSEICLLYTSPSPRDQRG